MIRRPPRSTLFPYTRSSDLGDVNADLTHGLDGEWTDPAVGLAAGAVHFVGAAAKLAEQARGHLAAHAIASAQDENARSHAQSLVCPVGQARDREQCMLPRTFTDRKLGRSGWTVLLALV